MKYCLISYNFVQKCQENLDCLTDLDQTQYGGLTFWFGFILEQFRLVEWLEREKLMLLTFLKLCLLILMVRLAGGKIQCPEVDC